MLQNRSMDWIVASSLRGHQRDFCSWFPEDKSQEGSCRCGSHAFCQQPWLNQGWPELPAKAPQHGEITHAKGSVAFLVVLLLG